MRLRYLLRNLRRSAGFRYDRAPALADRSGRSCYDGSDRSAERQQINDALPVSYFTVFAGALAMGGALTNTGAADLIGNLIADLATSVNNTFMVYLIIFMAAFIVTQFMLNSAVMWSLMPLVLATTKVMGINPIGAAVLVNISSTTAYMTPMSCPLIL